MSGTKLTAFKGIRPRIPESLLSNGEATIAQNCDFAYGELRNGKGGFALLTLSNAASSIYTDDGLSFYSWTTDVNAVRSPMVSDTFNRLYYTGDGAMRVADRLGMRPAGGPPSSSYYVGVPRPTVAPKLTALQAEQVTSSNATIVFKLHWEYGGVKYQELQITPTVVNNTQYQFTPPARDTATPEAAFPVLRMTANWLKDNAQVFDLYTDNSSFDSTGGLYSLSMSKQTDGSFIATLAQGVKESDKETRAYVFTQVNTYGEEGPPSDPALMDTSPVLPVSVTLTKNQVANYAPIKELRVYRTGSGTTITDYFYVGSVSVLSATEVTFNDNVKAELLNEVLSSYDYYPPDTGLKGLMSLPNGILCAWKGNELWFSEAFKPWAWPPKYVTTLPNAIVGGIPHGSGAIVTTTTIPYMVSGVSPDSMTATKINVNQAGVSKWSMAVVNGSMIYASNDGLVTINGATGSLDQSAVFFTREVWRQRYAAGLSTMRFSVWDGRLVVFSSSGAFTPFMIRFDEAAATMTDLTSLSAQCAFVSVLSDQMYYVSGQTLYQFNGGASLNCQWQSREMVMARPVNFGSGQAVCEGSWAIEFWAYVQTPTGWTYQLKHTQQVTTGSTTFRLPSGYESDRYRIKITGSGRFRELRVAQTARELATL